MAAVSAAVVASITNAIRHLLDDTLDTVSAVQDNSCIWKKVSLSELAWRIVKDESEKLTGFPKSGSGPGARCAMYVWDTGEKCKVPWYALFSIRSKIFKGFDNAKWAAHFAKKAKKSKLMHDIQQKAKGKKPDADAGLPASQGGKKDSGWSAGSGSSGKDNTPLLLVATGLLGILVVSQVVNKKK